MHIRAYLEMLRAREQQLANALIALAEDHAGAPDLNAICEHLAGWSRRHVVALDAFIARFPQGEDWEPAPEPPAAPGPLGGSYGLVHDLHMLWLLAQDVQMRWAVLGQVAWALRDRELRDACEASGSEAQRQAAWVRTRMIEAAPQAIIAAP